MNMNKPPDETLKQGRNRLWLLVKKRSWLLDKSVLPSSSSYSFLWLFRILVICYLRWITSRINSSICFLMVLTSLIMFYIFCAAASNRLSKYSNKDLMVRWLDERRVLVIGEYIDGREDWSIRTSRWHLYRSPLRMPFFDTICNLIILWMKKSLCRKYWLTF